MSLSKINDHLYLGAYADVAAAIAAGCTAVVNVADNIPGYTPPVGVTANSIPLSDNGTDACSQYDAVVDTVNGLIAQGKIVLIHCWVGVNRGPTMTALYYHEYFGYTWNDALALVQALHPDSSPVPALLATVKSCFPDEATETECIGIECCTPSPMIGSPVARTVYWNEIQSVTANCPEGYTGSPVTITIQPHTYSSYISVADANATAYAAALGQAADALTCSGPPTLYWNTQQTATCPDGQVGNPVVISAHTYSSEVSVAAANASALAAAEAQLTCNIAAELSGLLWEIPCTSDPGSGSGCMCSNPADQTITLSGDPLTTYNVTLRFRGVMELRDYVNGSIVPISTMQPDASKTHFVRLNPDAPSLVNPYNYYSLTIGDSNPTRYYYLNASGDYTQGTMVNVDFQMTIQMQGGALVTLTARTVDNFEVTNSTDLVVTSNAGLKVPQPYTNKGQFLQMDALSVTT